MQRMYLLFFVLVIGAAVGFHAATGWGKPIAPERVVPTLETALQLLAERAQQTPTQAQAFAASLGMMLKDGRVRVVVKTSGGLSSDEITRLGGRILARADALNLLEVDVPAAHLTELAGLPGVRFVRRPYRPMPLVISEGVGVSGANTFFQAGYHGQGARVAVIDVEFGGLTAALAAGELANVVFSHDYTGEGMEAGGSHGTACAEIVHDMAPRAELLLMKISTSVQLAEAVNDAITYGADVISHSVGWFNTNFYDGTGPVAAIASNAVQAGILWVNAAGNSADGGHWEGEWQDPDGDGYLDFAPGDESNDFHVSGGELITLSLTWDDWPASDQDYDLFLVNAFGQIVASSENYHAGTQEPGENLVYLVPFPGDYGVVIQAYSAPAHPRLELFCSPYDLPLEYSVGESCVASPANAPFVFAVGAIDWANWQSGPQEPFSARGPTNSSQHAGSIIKPDICGPDGGSVSSDGGSFYGTSAAAPHVAGAVALVWSAQPTWSTSDVRNWLESNAVDMGPMGKDNSYGHGRLDLSVGPVPPPPGYTTHTYEAAAGWHQASCVLASGSPADLYGTVAYRWNPSTEAYDTPGLVEPWMGVWVNLPASKVVTDTGNQVTADIVIDISTSGWHQISAPWFYPKRDILVTWECRACRGTVVETKTWTEAVVAGWVRDDIYGYKASDGAYTMPLTLDPWYGYWVRAEVSGLSLKLLYDSGVRVGVAKYAPKATPLAVDLPPLPRVPTQGLDTVSVLSNPNPVTTEHATTFWVKGICACLVQGLRVEVFDLSGRLVWHDETEGAFLMWNMQDVLGHTLANGVYLYRTQVKIGGEWTVTLVEKLVILR